MNKNVKYKVKQLIVFLILFLSFVVQVRRKDSYENYKVKQRVIYVKCLMSDMENKWESSLEEM